MRTKLFIILALLCVMVQGAWCIPSLSQDGSDNNIVASIPEQVLMSDGRTVRAMHVPRRASDEDYTYTYKGVKYTYISENNYTNFFNTSVHTPETYGWYKDDDGWFINAEGAYITAASIDEESVPENGEVYILNDLVGYFTSHTHLGCVADQGFTGESKVKRIYFQDANAQAYNANSEFHFFIGHKAFANAPHLEKVDLMQYTTKGTNHWEAMPAYRVKSIWDNAFAGSPNAMIRVANSVIDDYRNSSVWANHMNRIISYEPSGYEIKEYGARYKCMLAEDNETYLTNDGNQREEVKNQLRLWNADYQRFNASSLLAPSDNGATVYYTTIEGADAEYLKKNNGVLKIYNDIGSYYNYKNIAIRRNAFLNCEDLKTVEFWQTNGRSENSYSDLKICIENGAFRGCKNLKEIRLYYYVQNGSDHWETLGPEDVIPGDDIFGWGADFNEAGDVISVKDDPELHIVVSPTRYMDFINDPNWAQYAPYIVAADYEPTSWDPITEGGLTYDYASKTLNAATTSQVVTVETSWWTAVYWAAEVAIFVATMGSSESAKSAANGVAAKSAGIATLQSEFAAYKSTETIALNLAKGKGTSALVAAARAGTESALVTALGDGASHSWLATKSLIASLTRAGFLNSNGGLMATALFKDATLQQIKKKSLVTFAKIISGWAGERMTSCAAVIAERQAAMELLAHSLVRAQIRTQLLKVASYSTVSAFAGSRFIPQIQGLGSEMDADQFQNGLSNNLAANIHQVGMVGLGFTTPDKKLIYHTYISKAEAGKTDFTIYNDVGSTYNYRTVGISRKAFMGNKTVQTIKFAESRSSSYDSYESLMFTIPDSAFAGCTALREFDLRYSTARGSQQGLGPENFVLCGDSIFAGCDSTKLRIIVAEDRLQDFLDNESWRKYKRFLTTGKIEEKMATSGYGVNYAYAYKNNSTRHITYSMGHEVEHLYAYEADDNFLNKNNGALGLFNDVGNWGNYHLDYVKRGAFEGNQNLKEVSFWNVNGLTIFGESYESINITLQDKCFANCPNLEQMGLVYLSHSGTWRGSAKPLTPATLRLGDHVFDGSPNLKLKMMPSQVEAFMADSAWASYKDKFMPCLVMPADPTVKSKLSDLSYTVHCTVMNDTWGDIIDMSRLKEKGFEWLNGKFGKNDKIKLFPEFKQFEWAGLDFIGGSWFVNDYNLTAIELPSTIKKIGGYAFQNCDLREIEIPAAVTRIDEMAFNGNANLKVIRCLSATPAEIGTAPFEKPEGLKIYVPAEAVNAYKEKWSDYKDYIVADNGQSTFPKSVTTTEVGQLAEKLGLETIMDGNYLTGLKGAYWKIDSLTVSGPLNGVDVGVLRFLGGADVNNSDHTAGQMKYLNLYGASLSKDTEHPYQCWGNNNYLKEDDMVGDFMFTYCDKLQTVILPKSATKIGENVFEEAHGLKHLAIGDSTAKADNELFEDVEHPLEELVFLNGLCISDEDNCWSPGANVVYVPRKLIGEYMGRPELNAATSNIVAAFEDDEALNCFTAKGKFFPSEYFKMTNIDGILNNQVKSFDELYQFNNMTDLGAAFRGCDSLECVTLSDSLKTIGYSAFQGCTSLRSITVSADSVAQMESGALRDLPADFRIYVPKTHTKRYREAWPEYADHIEVDNRTDESDAIEITTTEYGQVAEKLGLETKRVTYSNGQTRYVRGVYGNYSNIRRLKINGPISGEDFAVLRYLGGYCGWGDVRNYQGRLEYLDLYDAQVVKSDAIIAEDRWFATDDKVKEDNVLPPFALRRAYALKTLILPKTLKEIDTRSLMECEALETVVIGDDVETINWDAFDDDVALTRMYILAKQKPKMDTDVFFWRWMCNNYNPTFDAFYVRPSLYNDYIADSDYTGSSWQRTNNISTGEFKDDESFAAFAAHAAATKDDLMGVNDVSGWFANRTGIKDLTPLRYTLVDSLKAADMKPLTKLERIAMPMELASIEDGAFADAKNLRWADFMMCDSIVLMTDLQNGGLRKKGLTENTLCYLPAAYGETDEVNVVIGDTTSVMNCANYRLVDGLDYDVPYKFNAKKVENTRTLAKSAAPYTVCLPYSMQIPNGAKAYRLSGRSSNELIFTETTETLQALQPYLIWTTSGDASLDAGAAEIPASGGNTFGKQDDAPGFSMRGTLYGISNAEAADLGAYTLQQDGKWHPVMSDSDEHRAARILPFRAYLLQNRVAGARVIGMTLEDVTGIEQLRTIDSDGTERIYDLNGRQLSAPTTGINIINGKKVIKR